MTDVNMDEPLPAIQVGEDNMGVPSLAFGYDEWRHMTLAQLVQVLAALTETQRDAVMIEALNRCPVECGPRRVRLAMAMHAGPSAYGELYAQAMEEKARADRAEQALALYRRGYDARGKLNVAYRIGQHPGEKTLDELRAITEQLKELETKNG